jgi:hypothetical protein
MQLVTIDTSTRHACLTKFFRGCQCLLSKINNIFWARITLNLFDLLSEYRPVVNVEHWTSAKDGVTEGNWKWCNGDTSVNIQETNWKGGQPNAADGECMFVQFSNRTANLTTFSLGDCAQKKRFMCEVITLVTFYEVCP